ncbi:MAG: hypothetical protein WED09_07115 [Homoserinimonas sp.]
MSGLPDLAATFDEGYRRRIVERTVLRGGVVVSTIWADARISPPRFETAIIWDATTQVVEQYLNEDVPVVGHDLWVSFLSE